MLDSVVNALHSELGLSAEEMADVLWLSAIRHQYEYPESTVGMAEMTERRSPSYPDVPVRDFDSGKGSTASDVRQISENQEVLNAPSSGSRRPLGVYPNASDTSALAISPFSRQFEFPSASAFRRALPFMKALKPLLRQQPVNRSLELNESATVKKIVDENIWLPVFNPVLEPWLEIAFVVEESESMLMWRQTILELRYFLKNYGLFRDVRSWGLFADESGQMRIRSGFGTSINNQLFSNPRQLLDAEGRRLILLLSDCISPAWKTGKILEAIAPWSNNGPVALIQMLPEWLWDRTELRRVEPVYLKGLEAGIANKKLSVISKDAWYQPKLSLGPDFNKLQTAPIKLPVLTLEPPLALAWSRMLSGRGGVVSAGFLLNPGISIEDFLAYDLYLVCLDSIEEMPREAVETVILSKMTERFSLDTDKPSISYHIDIFDKNGVLFSIEEEDSEFFSDDEFCGFLETVLSRSQPLDKTEKTEILQRILSRLSEPRQIETLTSEERVERFWLTASATAWRLAGLLAASPVISLPVVRLVQATLLPESLQVHVAEVLLGGLVRPKQPIQIDMDPDAVVYEFIDPVARARLLESAPVTETVSVLSNFIQKHFGQSLKTFIAELSVILQSNSDGGLIDQVRPFAMISAEVLKRRGSRYAEFIRTVELKYPVAAGVEAAEHLLEDSRDDFPPLTAFDFIHGQFIDRAPFPPVLATDTFTIATLERQGASSLDTFDITVARLIQADGEWQVQRQQQRAQRFVESLPDDFSLEMVAIPGGSFLMGSPKDEAGHYGDESPQHEVTVEPFFMGRYPITQAQWRVVSAMPQVERKLDPSPSNFEGDLHPVEKVSWYDAVEFCKRLSAHTGREYRLPTEAEWEYACRAGSTTPFHFGDMITTEVANYDGSSRYAKGPRGEYRERTTPVDQFGIANAYGLSEMHGNVYEWCQDHWHENYQDAPIDGTAWLTDDDEASRVRRGGSWSSNPRYCRSAYRSSSNPDDRLSGIGFRVSCSSPRALP